MTEKRFTLAYETNEQNCIWWAVRDGDITLWKEEVVGLLNELHEESEQLKQALREQLEENGNSHCIELLDKIFNLEYDEWKRKMNETHTYNYTDWKKVLKEKGDVE